MSETLIAALIGILTTFAGSFCSWFFTKRKYNTEVDQNQITNMSKSLDFYVKLSNDNQERLQEILDQNEKLTQQVQLLRQQVLDLTSLIHREMGENFNLDEYVKPLEDMIKED